MLSLHNSIAAAAAENQQVLGKSKKIDCARVQLRDGVVALAQDLNKVRANEDGVRKSAVALKDECLTAMSRMIDCQQEIYNASQAVLANADAARAVNKSAANAAKLLADVK